MMNNALNKHLLSKSQYARKHAQSVEVITLKPLFYDGIRIYKTPGKIVSNDAQGCFDPMALPIRSLALRRLGFPKRAIRTLMNALKRMKNYVWTGQGDIETFYQAD